MSISAASEFRIVLTTAADLEEAERIASVLVERRLAACAHLVTGVKSIYHWQDKVERAEEVQIWIKTSATRLAAMETALKELHSYELPELLVLAPECGSADYLGWLKQSLGE